LPHQLWFENRRDEQVVLQHVAPQEHVAASRKSRNVLMPWPRYNRTGSPSAPWVIKSPPWSWTHSPAGWSCWTPSTAITIMSISSRCVVVLYERIGIWRQTKGFLVTLSCVLCGNEMSIPTLRTWVNWRTMGSLFSNSIREAVYLWSSGQSLPDTRELLALFFMLLEVFRCCNCWRFPNPPFIELLTVPRSWELFPSTPPLKSRNFAWLILQVINGFSFGLFHKQICNVSTLKTIPFFSSPHGDST
jgi:hypothetical protein